MKKALITGASRGIGKAIFEEFKKMGYEVYGPPRAELDLLEDTSIEAFIEKNKDTAFDVIVNNAGINDINIIEEITDVEIAQMLQVNLVAPMKLLRGLVPAMKKRGSGHIVNVGSIWATVSKSGRCVYSATKNGIHGVTNTLAVELAPYNILVNTVCPGFTKTELTIKNNSTDDIKRITSQIPMGRMAEPNEIAKVVYYLCSENNTYLTGQKIVVDGGFSEQ